MEMLLYNSVFYKIVASHLDGVQVRDLCTYCICIWI